jgi:hypothetical protein
MQEKTAGVPASISARAPGIHVCICPITGRRIPDKNKSRYRGIANPPSKFKKKKIRVQ